MGVSLTGTLVRSGEERATLVRRTYGLVFVSVIVTALGVAFALTQPALMQAVIDHPIITMIAMFAPLWMAMRARAQLPAQPAARPALHVHRRAVHRAVPRRSPNGRARASPARRGC